MRSLDEHWRMTRHADQRRIEMGLTSDDVRTALLDPIEQYANKSHTPQGRWIRRGGSGVCVVDEPTQHVVVTVLWDGAVNRDRNDRSVR